MHVSQIDEAVRCLGQESGVIVVPTDTTYGLICRLDHPDAVERIYEIKGRDHSKPLIILAADADMALSWASGNLSLPVLLAQTFWPGALTIVVRASEQVPGYILASMRTVGLRVPRHSLLRDLLRRLPQGCVASTSANISGAGAPRRLAEVLESIGGLVDCVVQDIDEQPAGTESTIVDVSGDQPVIIRQGEILAEKVLGVVKRL